MSAARIITHRGFKGVLRDNSITGILLAVFKKKFCELDVLYVEGVWKLCHDFGAFNLYSADLTDLLNYLGANHQRVQNNIIVDVKWDWVWNRIDDMGKALADLKAMLMSAGSMPLWVQACDPCVLDAMKEQGFQEHWKLGMIVTNPEQFKTHKHKMNYAMVSLHEVKPEDVEQMSKELELVGFTCRKADQLPLYKHLFPFLKGIVCDMSV